MVSQNIINEVNSIEVRDGPCHFGIAANSLIGDRCKDVGESDIWTSDLSLVTCHTCKWMAGKVLRWAMSNPQRIPKGIRTNDSTLAF